MICPFPYPPKGAIMKSGVANSFPSFKFSLHFYVSIAPRCRIIFKFATKRIRFMLVVNPLRYKDSFRKRITCEDLVNRFGHASTACPKLLFFIPTVPAHQD